MELRDYIRILRRNWLTIVCFTALGVFGAVGASVLAKPIFTAETQLFVAIQNSGSITDLQQGNTFSQARVQSYVRTAVTPAVLSPALTELGLDLTPQEFAGKVRASAENNTVLISISVSDPSASQAANMAQAVASSLAATVENLEKSDSEASSPVKLTIITPAAIPESPSTPNSRLNVLVGFLVGLALGIAVAVMRTALDNKVRGEADLRKVTEAPVLGGITFDKDASRKPLLTQTAPQSPRAESFRQLRTNMQFASISRKAGAVMVTSSLPSEGKSTTATNIAIALSQAGQRVALVDADLRRPTVSEYLGLDRNAGLTTALLGNVKVEDLLQPWGEDKLYVLTSGQIPPNPSEILGSDAMLRLIRQLEQDFDAVIIDAPPLLPVTDAAVLSQHVGNVVLVVSCQKTHRSDVAKSLEALELVGTSVLGIVLNKLPTKGADAYAYSYHNYESHSPVPAESRPHVQGQSGLHTNPEPPSPARREKAHL